MHFSFEVLSGSASLCIEKEDHCLDLFFVFTPAYGSD